MITTTQLRLYLTTPLSDAALAEVITAQVAEIERYYPGAPDDAYRDMQIVELAKNWLAYDGYASQSLPGVVNQWQSERIAIASRRRQSMQWS